MDSKESPPIWRIATRLAHQQHQASQRPYGERAARLTTCEGGKLAAKRQQHHERECIDDVRSDAKRAERSDRKGLDSKQSDVHDDGRHHQAETEASDSVANRAARDDTERHQERDARVEPNADPRQRPSENTGVGASSYIIAAARLVRTAQLVDGGIGRSHAVMIEKQESRKSATHEGEEHD